MPRKSRQTRSPSSEPTDPPERPKYGRETPRLFTEPNRPLTRETSKGFEFIDFCEQVVGMPLLPWQKWLAIHMLELNPDGSYRFRVILVLCGRQNGKTTFQKLLKLWRMYVDGVELIYGVAQDRSIALENWRSTVRLAESIPWLAADMKKRETVGDETMTIKSTGARYRIGATTRGGGRSLSVDHLDIDEIAQQRDWRAWAAASKTTMARPHAITVCITTMGDDESVVLNHLHESALARTDPSLGMFEWSGAPGCDLDDWEEIAQANPGLGHTISWAAIESNLATDPPEIFRTEILCQRVDALDGAVSVDAWKACADLHGTMDGLRDRVALCLDVAPDLRHVSLVAAAVTDDDRVRVEVVDAWESTEEARQALPDWLARIKPRALGWFPNGPAASLAADLRKPKASQEIKAGDVAAVCQGFSEQVSSRRVLHPNDPLLTAQVSGASKLYTGDGWRFTRKGVGHVDAAYAVAGATHLARTLPPRPKPMVVVGRRPAESVA